MRLAVVLSLFVLWGSAGAGEPVRVVAYDEAGREVRAAGGVVLDRDGYVVTARSVLLGARRLEVATAQGGRLPVRWIAGEDPGAGLVKLWIQGPAGDAPEFRRGDPEATSILRLEGKNAPVRKVRDVPGSGVVAELDTTAEYSQAGTPLLDEQERVAGVLVPQFLGTRNVAYCVPVSHALEMAPQPLLSVEEWFTAHDREAEEAYQLALGQIWAEHYDSAARNLLQAVTAKSDFAEAWFHLGFAHAKLGHADEKIRYYRRAISLKPDFAEAHFSLGFSLLLQGKRPEAQQEVEALRKISAPALADKLAQMIESIHIDVLGKHDDEVI